MNTSLPDQPHRFKLAGMKVGDWFLGCPKCWTQYPTNAAGATRCTCGGTMLIYDIHHLNMAEVAEHNARASRARK